MSQASSAGLGRGFICQWLFTSGVNVNIKSIRTAAIGMALGLAGVAAQAQFGGNTCTSVAGTYPAQTPLSGSMTISALAKYGNYPAQA